MKIKVITIWQPYASLIAIGLKENETRGWAAKYRGPIAIHAAKKVIPLNELFNDIDPVLKFLIIDAINREYGSYNNMPTGAIIAKGILSSVIPSEELKKNINPIEMACGDYTDGRFGWVMKDIKKLAEPIFVKGQQGLWNWDGD